MKKRQCEGCEQWLPADVLFLHGVGLHCRPCIEADDVRCGKCPVCKELEPAAVPCGFCNEDIPADADIHLVAKKPICSPCLASFESGLAATRQGAGTASDERAN